MMIHKAYKFRIYPNQEQQILIAKTIGCSRFVFNRFLSERNKAIGNRKRTELQRLFRQVDLLKKEGDTLAEGSTYCPQSSLRNLSDSYDRFFKKQNNYPHYKSKNRVRRTPKHTNGNIAIVGNKLKL